VLTWEHEHIPPSVFAAAEAAGVPPRPGADARGYAQDKVAMRRRLGEAGLPSPAWSEVRAAEDIGRFLAVNAGPAVLKTATGGYDGKGVRVVDSADDAADWLQRSGSGGPSLLIEERVDFERELAVLAARGPGGELRLWPVVESVQRDGVCAVVTAPAPSLDPAVEREAQAIARAVGEHLGVVGVFAVELFEVDGGVLVNELAMRPHNSGHWTMDGAVTGQFEQHLRAVLGLPLGDTSARAPWTVMANVLGGPRRSLADALPEVRDPGAKIHLYGKEPRPGRKLGHVNVSGEDLADVRARAEAAAAIVRGGGA
jgi:5-(carboxyamino)imidazole ribonucleotide synthase